MSIMFNRYVTDATTSEQDLHVRSGQTVETIGDPFTPDPDETFTMQRVRFADGFEAEVFADELTQAWTTEELRADFEVVSFLAPFVIVRRRSNGKAGTLLFEHGDPEHPRVYHHWVTES